MNHQKPTTPQQAVEHLQQTPRGQRALEAVARFFPEIICLDLGCRAAVEILVDEMLTGSVDTALRVTEPFRP